MIKSNLMAMMGRWQTVHNRSLSIPELAGAIDGVSHTFLYRLRDDQIRRLDLDKLEALCKFLDCTPNDLLWTDDEDGS